MKWRAFLSVSLFLGALSSGVTRGAEAPVRLSYFRFNNDSWEGDKGELPLEALHVTNAPSYDGGALEINDTNEIALLKYRTVETNGLTNFDFQSGSIRFWYKPFWSTKDRLAPPGYSWGNGPGQWVRLIEIGTWTPDCSTGLFALTINPDGTHLSLQTQDDQGQDITNVDVKISFTYLQPDISDLGPSWHEILVTYSPGQTAVYVDGQAKGTGAGITLMPPADVQAQGFAIGSSTSGTMQAQGLIDELEIFDRPVGEVEKRMNGWVMSAGISASLPEIQLSWRKAPYVVYNVQKRTAGSNDWTTLATNVVSLSYTDHTNVAVGQRYEYQVGTARLLTGIDVPPVENRGRVLLLVDQTVAPSLTLPLTQLEMDLAGDGWQVVRHDVPRHDDTNWLANPPEIAQIKAIIRDEWLASSNDLHSIFIIGHVPVPYSGFASPDGHTARPWPCDGYYGDMQGQWTDVTNYATANMAGDGKFDQQSYPAPLSIAVGRVDFALMPALYPDGGLTTNSEVDLLAQYLVKDHRYRCGQFTLPNRAIVGGFFNSFEDSDIYANALNNGSRWFGFDPGPLVYGDLFMARTPCLWGFEAGAGSGSVIYGENGTPHTIADLVNPATEPPIAFYMLKGSYFGEWNIENDLMRAILATPNYGLAVTWTRYFRWHLEALGMGDPIGTGLLDSQNDTLQSDSSRNLYLALMGDPTLRLQLTEPPADLSGTATNGNVFLSWNPSPAQDTQYLVYRSMAALDGPFSPVTSDPIGEDSFVDVSPPLGPKLYQVRALQRVVSGSGSFTNLSQGIFAIVYDDTTPPTTAASVSPSPNPAGWNNTNVVVSITADDGGGSGVASISYSASGATNIAPTMVNDTNVIVAISTQGITTISYFATDADGNSNATQTITVSIDTTPAVVAWGTPTPTTNAFGWNNTAVSIPWTASDALSGLATPGSSGAINFTAEGTNLTQNLTVTDIADNSASFASPAANVDLTPPNGRNPGPPQLRSSQQQPRGSRLRHDLRQCYGCTFGGGYQRRRRQFFHRGQRRDSHSKRNLHRVN